MKLPAKPGGTLWLRTVQVCEGGEHPWTEIPTGKQRWSDLRSPAPFITLNPGR